MVYGKDKIERLINYKDNIKNEIIKSDIEWLIQNYNEYYVCYDEFEKKYAEYKNKYYAYYNLLDENRLLREKVKKYKKDAII